MTYADRSGDADWPGLSRTTHADALHQAGRRAEALESFREAEEMQAEVGPNYPLLYSQQGFIYCDLLLAAPEREAARAEGGGMRDEMLKVCRAVTQRAAQTLKWAEQNKAALLTIALDHLTLGRAALYAFILDPASIGNRQSAIENVSAAVAGLRRAGTQDHLPRGLLTRAWLRFLMAARTGPESAQEDLDEAWEIAERGPMKLFMADIHLYRARLFGKKGGVISNQSVVSGEKYPWESPAADLAAAEKLINACGYHRRDEELADAKAAILRGQPPPP